MATATSTIVLSWGPLILGHAHPRVVEALQEAITRGTSYGAPTPLGESSWRGWSATLIPSVEMLRLVNSGTEATMSALRLARAFTGRDKIVKFAGGYHGHADMLLSRRAAGCPLWVCRIRPGSRPPRPLRPWWAFNDLAAVDALSSRSPGEIAAVIAEPIAANMGFIMPQPGFPGRPAAAVPRDGALFILDEVMTGFRVAPGGAQGLWGLEPDLTCLGKVIGGGLPLAAYGGKRGIMEMVAPAGPVYQAGTLSGNPLATTAGLTTLRTVLEPGVFAAIVENTAVLARGIEDRALAHGVPMQVSHAGTMFGFYFLREPDVRITDYASARTWADTDRYAHFFHMMLEEGVYFAPSQFEAAFMSTAHGRDEIDHALAAVDLALSRLP